MRFIIIAALLVLTACASSDDTKPYVERSVEDIYNKAYDAYLAGDETTAATEFDEVERQHPYSPWAAKAQLMAAYVRFEKEKYDDAILTLERFIQLHPAHADIAYAYYLKALSYYNQISDVRRDQLMTREALASLDEVISRFSGTAYARDAAIKRDLTLDHLAGQEMDVGRFYLRSENYVAALNRFRVVVQDYQTTSHVPEALHRLTECYLALGLTEEAQKTAALLGHNFPTSVWYYDSFALFNPASGATVSDNNSAGTTPAPEQDWLDSLVDWF